VSCRADEGVNRVGLVKGSLMGVDALSWESRELMGERFGVWSDAEKARRGGVALAWALRRETE
jgi:hypothetical protein